MNSYMHFETPRREIPVWALSDIHETTFLIWLSTRADSLLLGAQKNGGVPACMVYVFVHALNPTYM